MERPSCSSDIRDQQVLPQKIVYSDDEIQNPSSSDDSEDEMLIVKNKGNLGKRKRPVESMHSGHRPENPAKKTKYSVWSDIMQEDEIENQFVGSDFFGGSRGNESYNYKMKYYDNPYPK